VSPGRHFRDAHYEDFLASAAAIGPAIALAGDRPIGPTVLAAIEATARWVPSNTNLGIVLLFAPLARAALSPIMGGYPGALRERVEAVLDATTVADAREAYAAIRRARPGSLGRAPSQDISEEPTATLREVMALSADRDAIAREYASGFATTFEVGSPALKRARRDGLAWDDATVETYLTLLAAGPDTLIARKLGLPTAASISRLAQAAAEAGGVRTTAGRTHLEALDRTLRDEHNAANPGATADLTAAALFVVLLDGAWSSLPP
jgi:triphosphoribosyl-dephospho-CoA synthase